MDYYEAGGEVIVVEYLESSMSRGLLCKFPDNSSFDFDYSQSSIWSPVVPRPFPSISSRFDLSCGLPTTLFSCLGSSSTPSKVTTFNKAGSSLKRKLNAAVYRKFNSNNKPNAAIQFQHSHLTSSSQPPKGQGWSKLLKAASKQFKKKKNKKREATNVQAYNSNYFTDWDF